MSDEILDQYEKTLEAAVVPSYFLPEQFCNNGVQSVDYVIPPAFSANPKQASLETGAPPLQQVKPNLGGAYFPRQEYNGIFRLVTNILAYLNSGYNFTFDTKNTGGYPSNAVLYDYATGKWVQSLQDGNTNNFVTDPTLIDGTHWRFISVNPNTSNDFTVSPVVPTRPTGEQSEFTANMQALWNQTLGIGIGLNGQAVKSFNSVTDLYNTVNGGCYFGHGAVMPDPEGYYYVTRIASNDTNGTGAFLATDNSKIYFGFANPTIYSWTQITNSNDLISGLVNAIFNRVTVADYVKIGNQPTNSSSGLLINANLYYPAIVEPVMYAGKANTSFELGVAGSGVTQQAITFDPAGERPMINNFGGNYITDKGIATIGDIAANGGGIVASGTGWFKFKNGVIVQYGQTVIFSNTPQVQTLPISFSNAFYHIFLSAFGSNALTNNNIIVPNSSSSFALQSAAGTTIGGSFFAIGY